MATISLQLSSKSDSFSDLLEKLILHGDSSFEIASTILKEASSKGR
jgi:hypothetical protein